MSRVGARYVFFKKERAYLSGKRNTDSKLPSILFFAPERCATQYTNALISRLYEAQGGQSVLLPSYFFHANPKVKKQRLQSKKWMEKVIVENGFFYGCLDLLKGEGSIDYDQFTLLATVRDPRDVMVSSFYSVAYAHTPSTKKFAQDAKEAREKGIDWYVTQDWRIQEISEKLAYIKNIIASRDHSYVWRYEDMRSDFSSFLKKLAEHVVPGCDVSLQVEEMVAESKAEREAKAAEKEVENLKSHQRSGASGQYNDKLTPESIAYLNEKFAEYIDYFNY